MLKIFIKLIFIFFVTSIAKGQKVEQWINPVDIPIKLSGTFGELRSNHFHSGIDIKTGEKEGLNVYSVDTGYISRIKIQAGGYGNALYITHPNGITSVYAHLQKFNSRINKYVIDQQYSNQSFEIDLYPNPGQFPTGPGELIAYSGNSGSSGGPHLHFEIRDPDQKPMNPLINGISVQDKTSPLINYLKVYPSGNQTIINGKMNATGFYTSQINNSFQLVKKDTISIGGPAYFGINTIDLFNGGVNKNGVYSIRLKCNEKTCYEHNLSKFDFEETRYINALIDFKEYMTLERRVQYAYVQPNNKLSIYNSLINRGIINFEAGQIYLLEFEVGDAAGNSSTLSFVVKGVDRPKANPKPKNNDPLFYYNRENHFSTNDVRIDIPGQALYDTIYFHYNKLPSPHGSYSALHCLHYDYTPLQTWCTLSINADSVPEKFRDKALIVSVNKEKEFVPEGGRWDNGFVTTSIRAFGNYCIVVDTIPPKTQGINIANGKSLLAQTTIVVKITDDLSGINKYEGRLNGNWILMAYDEKNDLLTYQFDQWLKSGENQFELKVWDQVDNVTVYTATLSY